MLTQNILTQSTTSVFNSFYCMQLYNKVVNGFLNTVVLFFTLPHMAKWDNKYSGMKIIKGAPVYILQ